ncbi:MAG: class I SAM-dependent methyltransferase [Chitinophagaceae bacterium]|nr:MAG: class I SAM-dependent methyltransferase [Chitinophagaceae bacterium]
MPEIIHTAAPREGFQPVSNTPPTGFIGKLKYYGRMVLDLQFLTIVRDVRRELPAYRGKLLDVGCGQSPYRFYLDESKVNYHGIDIEGATAFGYHNPDVTFFDGSNIPFGDRTFDAVICTEVLEHVADYQFLVNEIWRTCKPGADVLVTIPWSARYHYIPYDFFRYTPSTLRTMFAAFSTVRISPRGNDLAVIGSKIIVATVRGLFPGWNARLLLVPIWIIFLPLVAFFIILSHLSLWFGMGSTDDPLGYTIILKK